MDSLLVTFYVMCEITFGIHSFCFSNNPQFSLMTWKREFYSFFMVLLIDIHLTLIH